MERDDIGMGHPTLGVQQPATVRPRRKRKAESQADNERLSKRLSLLNLEKSGAKLYVPVETPAQTSNAPTTAPSRPRPVENESMQLDDSKYKVYIYDLDAELSSESEPEDSGKLVFLPDIEKHMRKNRIPHQVLANHSGELAGRELVLYQVPSSISVPEEQDSVRKAILDARARIRERQQAELQNSSSGDQSSPSDAPESELTNGLTTTPVQIPTQTNQPPEMNPDPDDPDAMELD